MSLRDDLIRDEGRVAHAYQDSMGFWTIGVGHLIDERKGGELPYHIVESLLDSDIERTRLLLDYHLAWWVKCPEPVQRAMQNMCFQLGIFGLMEFKKAVACLQAGDYEGAQKHALDSKWAREDTPERAQRVCALFTEKEHT